MRFTNAPAPISADTGPATPEAEVQRLLRDLPHQNRASAVVLPGPTGESNRLNASPRAPLLCLGPGPQAAEAQASAVRALGGQAVTAPGVEPEALTRVEGFSGVLWWGDATTARQYAKALAARKGPILPLITGQPDAAHALIERHICIDTTASGGNAQLLAEVGQT
jgi:RHH-type transcriptional regulator, proline utilization regulon repressor / proline dehydrogenase / delta 1-pyrroline-5-carboxylate dehydrogenase